MDSLNGWTDNNGVFILDSMNCWHYSCAMVQANEYMIHNPTSTIGYKNITLHYWRRIMAHTAFTLVEYSVKNSSHTVTWNILQLYNANAKSLANELLVLPSECNNIANLRIRIRNNGSSDIAYFDNIALTGTPFSVSPTSYPTNNPIVQPSLPLINMEHIFWNDPLDSLDAWTDNYLISLTGHPFCTNLCAYVEGSSYMTHNATSTIGYKNISLQYFTRISALLELGDFIHVEYSISTTNTWRTITNYSNITGNANYNEKFHLPTECENVSGLRIRIRNAGNEMDDFALFDDIILKGIPITVAPTNTPTNTPTNIPINTPITFNPTTNQPSTFQPTNTPTSVSPTTVTPTIHQFTNAPTTFNSTSNIVPTPPFTTRQPSNTPTSTLQTISALVNSTTVLNIMFSTPSVTQGDMDTSIVDLDDELKGNDNIIIIIVVCALILLLLCVCFYGIKRLFSKRKIKKGVERSVCIKSTDTTGAKTEMKQIYTESDCCNDVNVFDTIEKHLSMSNSEGLYVNDNTRKHVEETIGEPMITNEGNRQKLYIDEEASSDSDQIRTNRETTKGIELQLTATGGDDV